ncbi:2Fe-2S iron-sulfur cluster-binding protein [Gloeobacter kilaueensis]|uniref:Ferredoxin n=1 Tax=Gloeobacter kilaueensis (strain ATCC BAA-2537 / CCAP 1431/1 / ULC 316 / JS1) TaxID=1183438 RepID=U5QLT0_GLOK1|nr:2Fe-2S iron-sulfur cluster-binding protein [Gloeobacter kilaueensis]AGY59813.1 ferredoxin [Gloeobacter kilaueensis JS1]
MPARYSVEIYDPVAGETYHIRAGAREYVLQQAEAQGVNLPFSCRNGACTSCAVRVLSGDLEQPEAMGLSAQLKALGYALLCVSYPRSDLKVELQAEDEVYLLQFGQQFAQGEVRAGLPLEGD